MLIRAQLIEVQIELKKADANNNKRGTNDVICIAHMLKSLDELFD